MIAYPVGAFAYSHGLETSIQHGQIATAADFQNWLADVLEFGNGRTTWCVCGCRSPWANEVQYTGLNEAATEENDNGILCWIGRVRQRNVDLYYG